MIEQLLERCDNEARKVVEQARQCAVDFNSDFVGTEHILDRLLQERKILGILTWLKIQLEVIQNDLHRILGPYSNSEDTAPPLNLSEIPFTPRARLALEHAMEESRLLGHENVQVEDILLGLLREQGGAAGPILLNVGLTVEELRALFTKM